MEPVNPSLLIESAARARHAAHAPYSGYAVGAALQAFDGRVFAGCNIENASYGLTVCAERTAIGSAIVAGVHRFAALAVVAPQLAYPCGACRQVLAEFCPPEMPVHLAGADDPGRIKTLTLRELLPYAFRFRASGPNADSSTSPGMTTAEKSSSLENCHAELAEASRRRRLFDSGNMPCNSNHPEKEKPDS